MDDIDIIDLYWERSENAIDETQRKYGKLCRHVAMNILNDSSYAEECVNDTFLGAWNSIPPARPHVFSSYLCRITRNFALKKYEYLHAAKRNDNVSVSLSEIEECVSDFISVEVRYNDEQLSRCINIFLRSLAAHQRNVFVRRYWYYDSVKDIMNRYQMSKSKVESMLFRMRGKLRDYLREEGFMDE